MICTDERYVNLIYGDAPHDIMKRSVGQVYKLKCMCGHDFIYHIGNTGSFACNVREERCICKFFHLAK